MTNRDPQWRNVELLQNTTGTLTECLKFSIIQLGGIVCKGIDMVQCRSARAVHGQHVVYMRTIRALYALLHTFQYLCLYPSIYLSVYVSIYLSIYIYLSIDTFYRANSGPKLDLGNNKTDRIEKCEFSVTKWGKESK